MKFADVEVVAERLLGLFAHCTNGDVTNEVPVKLCGQTATLSSHSTRNVFTRESFDMTYAHACPGHASYR